MASESLGPHPCVDQEPVGRLHGCQVCSTCTVRVVSYCMYIRRLSTNNSLPWEDVSAKQYLRRTARLRTGRSCSSMSSLRYLHCTRTSSLLLYVLHVLRQIRLKEENRNIILNSMRMPIMLSLLMAVPRIVLLPILCRTRLVYTIAIPERRQETFHILKLLCARTIHSR